MKFTIYNQNYDIIRIKEEPIININMILEKDNEEEKNYFEQTLKKLQFEEKLKQLEDQNSLTNPNWKAFFEEFDIQTKSREFDSENGETNLRKFILESELTDFQTLNSDVDDLILKLNKISHNVGDRMPIEMRNSFLMEIPVTYQKFLIHTKALIILLEKQSRFIENEFLKSRMN